MKHHNLQSPKAFVWTMAIPPKDRLSHYGPPLLIAQEEVVHRLGVSRTTVWRLVKIGELDSVRIGSRALITHRSVEDYLARHSSRDAPR